MFNLDKYLADLILNCRSAFGKVYGVWIRIGPK